MEAPTVADATMSTFYKQDPEKILAGASSSTRFFGERGRIFFIIPGRVSVTVSGGPGICYAPRSRVGINILYNAFQAAKGSKSKVSGALTVEARAVPRKRNFRFVTSPLHVYIGIN